MSVKHALYTSVLGVLPASQADLTSGWAFPDGAATFGGNPPTQRIVADYVALGPITLSGVAQTADGVANIPANKVVLATAQADATTNGVYRVAAGAWTKLYDAHLAINAGQVVAVTAGSTKAGTSWVMSGVDTVVQLTIGGGGGADALGLYLVNGAANKPANAVDVTALGATLALSGTGLGQFVPSLRVDANSAGAILDQAVVALEVRHSVSGVAAVGIGAAMAFNVGNAIHALIATSATDLTVNHEFVDLALTGRSDGSLATFATFRSTGLIMGAAGAQTITGNGVQNLTVDAGGQLILGTRAVTGVDFKINSLVKWQIDTSGHLVAGAVNGVPNIHLAAAGSQVIQKLGASGDLILDSAATTVGDILFEIGSSPKWKVDKTTYNLVALGANGTRYITGLEQSTDGTSPALRSYALTTFAPVIFTFNLSSTGALGAGSSIWLYPGWSAGTTFGFFGFPVPALNIRELRVKVSAGAFDQNLEIKVLDGGNATGLVVTLVTGVDTAGSDLAHPYSIGANALLGVSVKNLGGAPLTTPALDVAVTVVATLA